MNMKSIMLMALLIGLSSFGMRAMDGAEFEYSGRRGAVAMRFWIQDKFLQCAFAKEHVRQAIHDNYNKQEDDAKMAPLLLELSCMLKSAARDWDQLKSFHEEFLQCKRDCELLGELLRWIDSMPLIACSKKPLITMGHSLFNMTWAVR